ncbi:MAG: hypothetical protein V5789_08715 [Colwellia sp.]
MQDSQWQSLLKLGNDCFYEKQWSQAEFFYSEAYDILAYGYRNNPLSADILMAWVCTCHNLSSLYETMGNVNLSLKFLKVPHDYLMEIAESKIPDEDVKLIALKGMSLTIPPIMLFAKKYPMCDDCTLKLGSINNLIEQERSIAH